MQYYYLQVYCRMMFEFVPYWLYFEIRVTKPKCIFFRCNGCLNGFARLHYIYLLLWFVELLKIMVEIETMHIEDALYDNIDVKPQDTNVFNVSSSNLYYNSISAKLASIKNRIQNPLVEPTSQIELLWKLWEI